MMMSPYEWIFLEWDQKSTNKQKYIYTNDGKELINWLGFIFYSPRAYFTQMPVSNFKTHLYALQLYPCSFYYRKERIDAIGPSSRERKSPLARVTDTTRALARFLQNVSIYLHQIIHCRRSGICQAVIYTNYTIKYLVNTTCKKFPCNTTIGPF